MLAAPLTVTLTVSAQSLDEACAAFQAAGWPLAEGKRVASCAHEADEVQRALPNTALHVVPALGRTCQPHAHASQRSRPAT